jgi:hypothetical protein
VTLAALGVLVGLAIGSGTTGPKLASQPAAPVDVRTEVIRKTINIYRKAKPHHVAASATRGPGSTEARGTGGRAGATVAPLTRSSGARAAAPPATPIVSTRSSGARTGTGPVSPTRTVKTRTSGASSSGGSGPSHPVSTRSSGGSGDRGGGHDD